LPVVFAVKLGALVSILAPLVPIAPLPEASVNVLPEFTLIFVEAAWVIVPVPVAVKVTPAAPPADPMLAAKAMLPLEPVPVFCINTAPVAFNKPLTVTVGEPVLLSVSVYPAAVDAAADTAAAVSVTLTLPPDVVAIVGAFVPLAFNVIAPVPQLSCNVPVVEINPEDCEIVPVPVAVSVTDVA
jgi:hypothetical protein